MKHVLVALLAVTVATPVISIPVPSDAQVLVGSGAARRTAPRRPRLSEAELDRLTQAEDTVFEIDARMETIQTAAEEAGGLTAEQQTEIDALTQRREEAQRIIDRLEAKRNR